MGAGMGVGQFVTSMGFEPNAFGWNMLRLNLRDKIRTVADEGPYVVERWVKIYVSRAWPGHTSVMLVDTNGPITLQVSVWVGREMFREHYVLGYMAAML